MNTTSTVKKECKMKTENTKLGEDNLWAQIIKSPDCLSKFEGKACIYPEPYLGKSEVTCWFYSRNNGCQVFYSCPKKVADQMFDSSWADVSYEFTVFVEQELFPFCVENTKWESCHRYGIDYDKTAMVRDHKGRFKYSEKGCEGTQCHCQPFGEGDFTYGIAEDVEFVFVITSSF